MSCLGYFIDLLVGGAVTAVVVGRGAVVVKLTGLIHACNSTSACTGLETSLLLNRITTFLANVPLGKTIG